MEDLFILDTVVRELLNSDKSPVSPLMKLNYFGLITKNSELVDFTDNEINGYNHNVEDIPEYRYTRPHLLVEINAGDYQHKKEVPISMLEEPFRTKFSKTPTLENIAILERMAIQLSNPDSGQELIQRLPLELLPYIAEAATKLYKTNARINVQGAMLVKNGNITIAIINNVRTRLLKFVTQLTEKFGHKILIKDFLKNKEINNQIVQNFMATHITSTGDGNIINTGNSNEFQIENLIKKNNLNDLELALSKCGLPKSETAEILEIVQNEKPDLENKELGSQSKKWIEKTINGVGKTITTVTANVLTAYLKSYYGF